MGQAKQRGTFEERLAQAKERDLKAIRRESYVREIPSRRGTVGVVGANHRHSMGLIALASLVAASVAFHCPEIPRR